MKLFFIHILKTAGTSLFHILRQHFGEHNTCPLRFDDLHLWPRIEFNDYSLFFAHAFYSHLSLVDGPVFSATYLRDPVTRFISALDFMRREDTPVANNILVKKYSNVQLITDPRFRDIVTAIGNDVTIRFSNVGFRAPEPYPFDQSLDEARKNLNRLDFIGFSEGFVSSTERLLKALSIVGAGDLDIRLNQRSAPDNTGLDSDDLVDEIEHICRFDIALYEEQLQRHNQTAHGFGYRLRALHGPVREIDNVPVIHNRPDRAEIFSFGPYVSLPRGEYEVRYVIQHCEMQACEDGEPGALRFEACTDAAHTMLATDEIKVIPGEPLNELTVTLSFSLKTIVHQIEFRVFASRGLIVRQRADAVVTRRSGWKRSAPVEPDDATSDSAQPDSV
jgi:hypothetical protein